MTDFDDILRLKDLDQALINRFWAVFSRFEYALKQGGFAKKQRRAAPDWDEFARKLNAPFDLKKSTVAKAIHYIENDPPKEQIRDANGVLVWEDKKPQDKDGKEKTGLELWLSYVRRVRNNLFHGGKHYPGHIRPERDKELIESCLVILDECLTLSAQHCSEVYLAFKN
jgi:hypothetical protein